MRNFTVMAVLVGINLAKAQDNVVLRNGNEIPAKVLEVGVSDIKFRKADNPDGPVYTSPLRDVLFIKYANGTKDTFGPQSVAPADGPTDRQLRLRGGQPARAGSAVGLEGLQYQRRFFRQGYVDRAGRRVALPEVGRAFDMQPGARQAFERGRTLRTWSMVTGITSAMAVGAGAGMLIGDGFGNDRGRGGFGRGSNRPDQDGSTDPRPTGGRDGGRRFEVAGAVVAGSGLLLGATALWLNHRAAIQFRRAANRYNGGQSTSLRFEPGRQGLGVSAVLQF